MEPEIQRFCWFDTIPTSDTIWKYKRAIEGHKLIVVGANIAFDKIALTATHVFATFQIYDGHTYSHWGAFPHIFDQSMLGIFQAEDGNCSYDVQLHHWECKEITLSATNMNGQDIQRFGSVLWFYEVPMTKTETFEYAAKQPRYKIRHGGMRTAEEGGGYG